MVKRKSKRRNHSPLPMKTLGFAWRVSLSIIVGCGWFIFLIIWLLFYAGGFNIYQNIAIFLVSILIVGAILGSSWASWGLKYGYKYHDEWWNQDKRYYSRRSRRRK